MGRYLNPGNKGFRESLNSQIYVDKSGLIEQTNAVLDTREKYMCVSRPRCFGKTMALDMLAAYYTCGAHSEELFENQYIIRKPSFKEHLNQYNVLKINISDFLSVAHNIDEMLERFQKYMRADFEEELEADCNEHDLGKMMEAVSIKTGRSFVILIDEWDSVFWKYKKEITGWKRYLNFLQIWLNNKSYIALVYMTGIFPIKTYRCFSRVNCIFTESSMENPGTMASFFGFTSAEVEILCRKYGMNFDEARAWYDGYRFADISVYNPRSVVNAMRFHEYNVYWNQSATYEELRSYIQLDLPGLKEAVVRMMEGGTAEIDIDKFSDAANVLNEKDEVFTALVHFGYLNYCPENRTVSIPNGEVLREYRDIVGINYGKKAKTHSCKIERVEK